MRTITISAVRFYIMGPGEKLPDIYADRNFTQAYVIWPRKSGMWDVRWNRSSEWQEISATQFPTENAAFNAAHDHLVDQQRKLR